MVEMELVLKAQCGGCRTTKDLYGSQCKHMTLCVPCAKAMAMSPRKNKCYECGEPLCRLIREYNVRPCTTTDKKYFIGRFVSGLPKFSKKPKAENKWSLQKEGLKGRHVTPLSREKYKNTPWMLEDKTGQMQYRGHLEGQSATYYLCLKGRIMWLFLQVPGDDWEHEEVFTDDDDAVDPEGIEDFVPEISPPPEIKQDEEDEDENSEDEGGLSNSGKELKKLLGRTNDLNESDDDDDDDDDDVEDETGLSPVLAPKVKREEPINNYTTVKPSSASMSGTPTNSKSSKGKRKTNTDDAKASPGGASLKKVKTENDVKPSKDELVSSTRSGIPVEATQLSSSRTASSSSTKPVTEDEIRAVLQQNVPVTAQDLVGKFKSRLRTKEEKTAFAAILNLIARIQKTSGRASFIVLRDK